MNNTMETGNLTLKITIMFLTISLMTCLMLVASTSSLKIRISIILRTELDNLWILVTLSPNVSNGQDRTARKLRGTKHLYQPHMIGIVSSHGPIVCLPLNTPIFTNFRLRSHRRGSSSSRGHERCQGVQGFCFVNNYNPYQMYK